MKIKLSLPVSFAVLSAAAVAVTLLQFILQPVTGVKVFQVIQESYGLVFLLNLLPVAALMLLLFFITANLTAACGVPGLLFLLLSVVNRYMVAMRWSPFKPIDLRLGAEFLGIAKSIKPAVFIAVGAGMVLFAAVFAAALFFVKNAKPRLWARVIGSLACAAVMLALNFGVYASDFIHERLPYKGYYYNETDLYQSRGFTYSFLHDFNASRIASPVYYGDYREEIEAAEAVNRTAPAPASTPSIVMVLSEAFSELAMSPQINFDGYTDPLYFYKQILAESVQGYIVPPHTGGGTADTEFDILTGLNSRGFKGTPYAFSLINGPFPGVARVLKDAGYHTAAMHPGAGWFYNRQNVYPMLGFDYFWDDKVFDVTDTKGLYITERHTVTRMLEEVDALLKKEPAAPFFLKAITIQNHGPYVGKYDITGRNYNTDADLSPENLNALAHYFHGLMDSDRGIFQMITYFRNMTEPVVLVYYGDHMPSFPPEVYKALIPPPESGKPVVESAYYGRTPFFIWANDAAKESVDLSALKLPEDGVISAHYLGAAVLELIGLGEADPLMEYINDLREDYPVVLERTFTGRDGVMRVFDPAQAPELARYDSWAYHRIMGR
ncbi:MAG: LTA synthase family protein [Clostridiales bacterium]|jgi:phosphoglycerol transferase MdoB-like AlkP superfamily enzyme|nr:LTA synthase family protein [Clostridiales bacterium]